MHPLTRARLRWDRRGVRARSTFSSVTILGIMLLALGLVASVVLQIMLLNSTRQSVALRAHDIATQISARGVSAVQAVLTASSTDQTVIQVVRINGSVVAATTGAIGEAAMLTPSAAMPRTQTTEGTLSFIDNGHYMLAAERVGSDLVVITAQSLVAIDASLRDFRRALFALLPIVMLLTGWAIWAAVGKSLRSIDAIRRQVDTIGANDLHERIPIPAAADEVAHLARTMNAMLQRLDDSARSQRRFIADASHELRSPLASMRTSLEVDALAAGNANTGSTVLASELERMTRLVNDLLLLAKVDEHALDLRAAELDLDDLVSAEVRRLRHQTSLEVTASITAIRVVGDADRLAQAIRNLTDNAQRHAQARIHVALRIAGANAEVVVEDDGPGVPLADRQRIFERFVRLDEHRARNAGGSGLGLAITREIAVAHGGDVRVETGELGGAQFVLTLPLDTASSR